MTRRKSTVANVNSRGTRIEEMRGLLEHHRRALLSTVHEKIQAVRDQQESVLNEGLDDGELSEVDVQEDIAFALIQMKTETLRRIDEAMDRLNAGVYGYCASCGAEIATSRLRALPFAVRCVSCEQREEASRPRESRIDRHRSFADRNGLELPHPND